MAQMNLLPMQVSVNGSPFFQAWQVDVHEHQEPPDPYWETPIPVYVPPREVYAVIDGYNYRLGNLIVILPDGRRTEFRVPDGTATIFEVFPGADTFPATTSPTEEINDLETFIRELQAGMDGAELTKCRFNAEGGFSDN